MLDLHTSAGVITTTEDHPFWNQTTHTYQPADALTPGTHLRTPTGRPVTVHSLSTTTRPALAYNLTIDHLHTYYVVAGDSPVLVHNTQYDPAKVASAMNSLLVQRAGFTGRGQRIIVDENMSPKFAEEPRMAGYDARSVSEMGLDGTEDPEFMRFASQLDAKVLTRDRGRQLDGGFASRAIQIDRRITSIDGILRVMRRN